MKKPHLKPNEWLELEAVVTKFEKALHQRQRPALREFLVGCRVDTVTLLLELVAAEIEHRSLLGEIVTNNDYLKTYADLLVTAEDRLRLSDVFDDVQKWFASTRNMPHDKGLSSKPELSIAATAKSHERYQWIERISPSSSRSSEP